MYKSPKHKSPKRKSPKHKSPKHKSPKHKSPKRKSPKRGKPETPASEFNGGTKRKGADGSFYKVYVRNNGVHYWKKCGPKSDGGSHCRFVGPARK